MRHPYVLRVESPDDAVAERLVAALHAALHARRAPPTRILTQRGEPAVRVGVRADEDAPAWLPPLRVSPEPDAAAGEVVSFLERWGFVASPHAS